MSPPRERMSPVDTAWLRMDRENHLMAIKGVLVLEGRLSRPALERLLEERLLRRFPRFSQRVVQDEQGAWWEHDPDFDLRHHVRPRRLPPGDAKTGLERLVSRLAAEPLPAERPLWSIEWIDRCGPGSALVLRVHHCMADGLALVALMRCLSDAQPEASARGYPTERAGWRPAAADAVEEAHDWTQGLGRWLQDPQATALLGQAGGLLAADVLKLMLLPQDSPTRLKGRTGRRKALAWSAPLPLPEVKAAARALGCSVNDVLLSCVAGGLRRHLLARGDDLREVNIRTLVPVNLRPSLSDRLGNRFGFVPLRMPLYESNLLARVALIHQRMGELKGSMLPPLSLGLLGLLGLVPRAVQGVALELLASKATAVVTHVPGPRQPRWLAGVRIQELMFWVPQSGDVGVGVSIISYGDTVRLGLISDALLVEDPTEVLAFMRQDFDELMWALLLCADAPLPDPSSFARQLRAWTQQNQGLKPSRPSGAPARSSSGTAPAPARPDRAPPGTSPGKRRA